MTDLGLTMSHGATMEEKNYDVQEVVVVVDRDRYVREFRDVPTFEACCKQCPNYGNRWGCPPFDHDTLQDLLPYEKVKIIGVKITPHDEKLPLSQAQSLMRPEIERVNKRLLEMEREKGGLAFGFVGDCPYCNGAPCARLHGEPCRHPQVVRPSLEAFGFDIGKTTRELLGIEIQWSRDKRMPKFLTLVCGLFYNE